MRLHRFRRFALGLSLLAASMPNAAPASDGGAGCGSDEAVPATAWRGSATCHFAFGGLPLFVRASATASGTATVHVWISLLDGAGTIVECSNTGWQSTSCSAALPNSVTSINVLRNAQTLFCHVQGTSTGHYHCQSALGI